MTSLAQANWLNEPPQWSLENESLHVVTGKDTDFWQQTFYNFVHDDGHFLFVEAEGDFTASITFDGRYETLYDQAGLMVRIDAKNWIKLGIEYSDGECNFSLVCTNNARSDWSVIPVGKLTGPQQVRITRIGGAAIAHYRKPDGTWQMMRLCPFSSATKAQVGAMACSPQRASFEVTFSAFEVAPPIPNPLHG